MSRIHIKPKDYSVTTRCGLFMMPAHTRKVARRKIKRSGIGNYCRSCARAEKLFTPEPTLKPVWRKKLTKLISERLCKGSLGCDAGAAEKKTGPCAGCSDLLEIADEMGLGDLS